MMPILWLPEEERRSYWSEGLKVLPRPRRRLERKARCLIATFLAAVVFDAAILLLVLLLLGKL